MNDQTKSDSVEKIAKRQYFYKRSHCPAHESNDPACICWWDEGTGPFPSGTELVELTWRESLATFRNETTKADQTKSDSVELLPCPLACRASPLPCSDGHKVFCPICGFSAPINSWNRRALPSASAQEAVATFVQSPYGNYPELKWRAGFVAKIGDCIYAAPPSQPVSTAEFEKALDEYARALLAESDENDGNAIGYIDAIISSRARAEVLRLASAGVRQSVSREAFNNALRAMRWSNSVFATSDAKGFLDCLGIEVQS